MSTEEASVFRGLCKVLKESLDHQRGSADVTHDEVKDTCYFYVTPKGFDAEAKRKWPGIEQVQAYPAMSVVAYNETTKILSGEALVPHCPTAKPRQALLLTPYIDLCGSCKIDQVHMHSGPIPTTHLHFECDLADAPNKRACIANTAWWMGGKLAGYARATCIEG